MMNSISRFDNSVVCQYCRRPSDCWSPAEALSPVQQVPAECVANTGISARTLAFLSVVAEASGNIKIFACRRVVGGAA
jgi:hypothetical protein